MQATESNELSLSYEINKYLNEDRGEVKNFKLFYSFERNKMWKAALNEWLIVLLYFCNHPWVSL